MFIAGLIGVEASYLELNTKSRDEPWKSSWLSMSHFGIPVGFHAEATMARVITPSLTYAYIQNIGAWGGFAGQDSTLQFNLRLWPGALFPSLGSHLWVDAGWLWTSASGPSFSSTPLFNRDFDISGPFLGFGLRF